MAVREKLVARIQKLLALASSNPSTAEAEAALLQARKLMAEHDVSEDDVTEKADEVEAETAMSSGRLNDLKASILLAIAVAHRCKLMYRRRPSTGNTCLDVVGYSRDRAVVMALYEWAWRVVGVQADVFVKLKRREAEGRGHALSRSELLSVRRSFIRGFSVGLARAYGRQAAANPQWALVLAAPKEVADFVETVATSKAQHSLGQHQVDRPSFNAGIEAGQAHVSSTPQKDVPELSAMPKMLCA
jgi:hypothetical protein